MKKYFSVNNLYNLLLLCFVVSLCIFHGKVLSIGFIRNMPSDFLAKQFFLADIFIVAALVFALIYKKVCYNRTLLFLLSSIVIWSILPRGTNYNYYAVLRLIECVACFYIFFHVENKDFLYKTLSILGAIESIIGIIQFHLKHSIGLHVFGEPIFNTMASGIAKIDLPNGLKVVRAYGTFSHPNSLGAFLVITLAFTTYLIFKLNKPWLYCINLFIIMTGVTVTFSRGALLSEIVFVLGAIGLIFWKKATKTNKQWIFAGIIVFSGLISIVSYGTYLNTRATVEDSSTTLRVQFDKGGVEVGKQHVLFGVGQGNVIYAMNQAIPTDQPAWMVEPPHNYLIIVSDETGIIGLILFLALLIYMFTKLIKTLRQPNGEQGTIETIIMFWLLIALLILMQVDHYFYDIPLMALLFWMTLGIIFGVSNKKIRYS